MSNPQRSRNYLALGLLIVGKLLGIGGLVVGSSSRILGGTLLALDGILITAAVIVCVGTMRARAKEDAGQKELLRQMMKEGTLKQYLRDLEDEQRTKRAAESDDSDDSDDSDAEDDKPAVARQTALS